MDSLVAICFWVFALLCFSVRGTGLVCQDAKAGQVQQLCRAWCATFAPRRRRCKEAAASGPAAAPGGARFVRRWRGEGKARLLAPLPAAAGRGAGRQEAWEFLVVSGGEAPTE